MDHRRFLGEAWDLPSCCFHTSKEGDLPRGRPPWPGHGLLPAGQGKQDPSGHAEHPGSCGFTPACPRWDPSSHGQSPQQDKIPLGGTYQLHKGSLHRNMP